ncbi:MAG: J domain-containing protein [Spirochaetales bacterium]|nr:J domain-containing protein [Spirochaetales bacterium]
MSGFQNYYAILHVSPDADAEEIRGAFRKLAHKHHPDKNSNSAASVMLFRTIREAYETLVSAEQRRVYDEYLANAAFNQTSDTKGAAADGLYTVQNILSQLNFVLWEIEDLYTKTPGAKLRQRYNCYSIEEWLSVMLAFLDKWVLTPAGFGDCFFTARQIERDKPYDPLSRNFTSPHLPYTDYLDYFYQIRRRADKFIGTCGNDMLSISVGEHGMKLIDGLFETLRLSYHYLVALRRVISGASATITLYTHTTQGFSSQTQLYIGSPDRQDYSP